MSDLTSTSPVGSRTIIKEGRVGKIRFWRKEEIGGVSPRPKSFLEVGGKLHMSTPRRAKYGSTTRINGVRLK